MKNIHKLLLELLIVAILTACGGGGGGSSTASSSTAVPTESTQLTSSVGDLTRYQLTAGNAADLSGSTTIALGAYAKSLFAKLNNFFITTAAAQSVSSCSSSGLNGTSNKEQWNLIGLSTSKTTPACVSQIQDAGKYLVLQASGVTDSSGNACDLVAIAKSSGATSCLRLPLPNRASVGSPVFYLDPSNGQRPGQLTLNGKYFFAGFYTKSNSSPQYTGFARVDFTGTSPTISVPYASYGVCSGTDCTRLNSQDPFWAPYYPMENGDLMFTQFNLTGDANVVPNIGTVQTYYVVSNPEITDPTQAVKALVNQTITTPTDGYSIDMAISPVAKMVSQLSVDISQIWYNNDAFSDPTASSTAHTFFLNVNTNSASYQPCSTNMLLLKGTVSSAGVLTLTNYGGSNLGNGLGNNSLSNDVTPDSSGNLFTLLWQATSSTSYTVTKYTRPLTQGVCGTSQAIYTGVSTGLTVGNISIQTIRSANTVYMQNFPYWIGEPSCSLTLGCSLANKIMLGYDLVTGAVSPISLSPLSGSQYYVYGEYSASTADRIYFNINDNSTTPPSVVRAQLTPTGFQNIIKFKSGVAAPKAVINGAVQ